MSKIYTKIGDRGETTFYTGEQVKKNDCRIEAIGAVDELNSLIGLVKATIAGEDPIHLEIKKTLEGLQHDLFTVGAEVSLMAGNGQGRKSPKITAQHLRDLEKMIDEIEEKLKEQKNFILPGGTPLGAWLHFGRTIARRTERNIVGLCSIMPVNPELLKYLNRLSDLLYVLARYANKELLDEQQPIYKYFGENISREP